MCLQRGRGTGGSGKGESEKEIGESGPIRLSPVCRGAAKPILNRCAERMIGCDVASQERVDAELVAFAQYGVQS